MEGNSCTFPAEEKTREPKDRWHGVYLVFYYTGLAILFPYTMLITVTEFWNYKWLVWFPNPLAAGSGLGERRGQNALFFL